MLKNMKNQCGKIGIDCEWCDNKPQCLIKDFYRDVLFNSDKCKVIIENTAQEIFTKLSDKIKLKDDFKVCEYLGNECICITIWREKIEDLYKIIGENTIKSINASMVVFNRVKEMLQEEFDFSQIYMLHKSIPNNKIKTFLYFIP